MRAGLKLTFLSVVVMATTTQLSRAQTIEPSAAREAAAAASLSGPPPLTSYDADPLVAAQPAGPLPTPRHTGIKATAKHVVTNFKYLPSMENLLWAGAGGGLALAAHPFDDNVNREL